MTGNPFRGLAPFDDSDEDAELFFGRDTECATIIANLLATRVTVLYGASGSGKSSLLRAGVAHGLRRERVGVVVFSGWRAPDPSGEIVRELAAQIGPLVPAPLPPIAGLPDAAEAWAAALGEELLLVLDQVEEYFTYHPDAGDGFAADLAELVRRRIPVNVLLAVREDALARLDRFGAGIPGVYGNLLRLDRLDRQAALTAITGPVARPGDGPAALEPGLAEAILEQVTVGLIDTDLAGRGTLADPEPATRIEAPYLQLVMQRLWEEERARGSEVIRSDTLAELGGAARIVAGHFEDALAALAPADRDVAARMFRELVTPSGTKIAHTADDLAEYASIPLADADRLLAALGSQRILRPLGAQDGGIELFEIFHDVLAAPALAWRARHEADRRLEKERAEARRRHRRLAGLAGAALVALIVVLVITAYALSQREEAREQARSARARALDAQAVTSLESDPELALLLALEAARIEPDRPAERVLRASLQAARGRGLLEAGGPIEDARLANGKVVVERANGATLEVDLAARTLTPAAVARDEQRVDFDGTVASAVAQGGEGGARRLAHPAEITVAIRRADLVATGDADGVVRVWDLTSDRAPTVLAGHVGRITDLAVSPAGDQIATASSDGTARIWNLPDGDLAAILVGHGNFVLGVSFSPNGEQVATASSDRTARVWSTATGAQQALLAGHREAVTSVVFTPGGRVVTASRDGTVRAWDPRPDPTLALLARVSYPVTDVRFDGRGAVLAVDADGRAHRIDRRSGREIDRLPARPDAPIRARDGTRAQVRGSVVQLDRDGKIVTLTGHRDDVTAVTFSDDSRLVATASVDHDARVWDARTGRLVHVLLGHFAIVSDVAFSRDGRWIVTAGPGSGGLWDAETGALVAYLRGHQGILTAVAFDAEGRTILTAGADGTLRTYACDICGDVHRLGAVARDRLRSAGRSLTAAERKRYLDS